MTDETPQETASKTKQKQAMHELQALGEALLDLPAAQLDALQLPDALLRALREAKTIAAHGAKRRQIQYIGRLMRDVDAAPIRERLALARGESAQASARHRRLEQWRARLMEDDAALTEFAQQFPRADTQILRTLIRNARREQKEAKPPRAFRELFRLLREAAADGEASAD
jgi:ribosome-associated protein